MRLLLTGATGCVGNAVVKQAPMVANVDLYTHSHSVMPAESDRRKHLTGGLDELADQVDTLPPVESCIHAGGIVHRPGMDEVEIFRVNCENTVRLAEALAVRGGLRRFVFVSTIAVANEGAESSRSAYAASKLRAEAELKELAKTRGFSLAVVRLATVYGPHDRGNIGKLYRAVRRRRYVRVVPPETRKSLIYVDAAAAGLLAAADPAVEVPWLSVLADEHPWSFGDIETAMTEVSGVPSPPRIPDPLPALIAAVGTALATLLSVEPPLTLERLRTLRQSVDIRPGPPSAVQRAAAQHYVSLAEGFRRSYADVPA